MYGIWTKPGRSNPSGNCVLVAQVRGTVHVSDDKAQQAFGPCDAACLHYTEAEFDNGWGVKFQLVNTASVPEALRQVWDEAHPERTSETLCWYAVYGGMATLYFTIDEHDAFRLDVADGKFAAELVSA